MSCDMCGKKGESLDSIVDRYKTKDVQQICSSCTSLLNSHIWKIRAVTDGMLKTAIKRFIDNTSEKLNKG